MKDYLANEVRNVVVLGHSGAGKTAVIEGCMHFTKRIDKTGKNNDGTSALDFDLEEGKRGTSCYCHLAPVEWKEKKINFIDTKRQLYGKISVEIDTNIVLIPNLAKSCR